MGECAAFRESGWRKGKAFRECGDVGPTKRRGGNGSPGARKNLEPVGGRELPPATTPDAAGAAQEERGDRGADRGRQKLRSRVWGRWQVAAIQRAARERRTRIGARRIERRERARAHAQRIGSRERDLVSLGVGVEVRIP